MSLINKMDIKEEKVCRICFNFTDKDFEVIDETARDMFELLLLKMDFGVTENPVMCHGCAEVVKKCYRFKMAWNNFPLDEKGSKLELHGSDKVTKGVIVETNTCQFCMDQVKSTDSTSINCVASNATFANMFPVLMPELVTTNSVICKRCTKNLEYYLQFVTKCLDTEQEIKAYCQVAGTNSLGQVNLSDIICFVRNEIKLEANSMENHAASMKPEAQIKDEAITSSQNPLSDENIHKCHVCTYTSHKRKNLTDHMRAHRQGPDVKIYKCTTCTYQTRFPGTLSRHSRMHKDSSEVKMYKCTTCTFETKYKTNIKPHMLLHKDNSEVQTYKCEVCTYETKYKYHLREHLLIHKDRSEVKMYKCAMCRYETKYKSNLNPHMLSHKEETDVAIYKCEVCSYRSKYKSAMKRHALNRKCALEIQCKTERVESS